MDLGQAIYSRIVGHPKSAPAPVTHKAPEVRWIG